jgi:steroid 5-alpha reductase family enzyme
MSPDPLTLVLTAYAATVGVMAGLWAVQLLYRNASIADVGWCAGLIAAVCWYAAQASGDPERKALAVVMVSVYAGRLGLYLLCDRIIGKAEDARYRRLRTEWGRAESLKMFGYFQLQAGAVALFSLPFLAIIQNPRPPFGLVELVGMIVWIIAVGGEAVADSQLARFRSDPANRTRVLRNGFWRYSRHPNYFFEWLHWWAYVVMTIGSPGWLLTWLAPLGMGWTLLKVTGIPPAEQEAVERRGEEYRIYQETTSAFVPWFPRPRTTNRG